MVLYSSKPAFLYIMDTQEAKEAGFTPMQSIQLKMEKLESGYEWLKAFHRNALTYLALLAGLVFFLFTRMESRMDKIDSRIDKLESGIQEIQETTYTAYTKTGRAAKPARYKA